MRRATDRGQVVGADTVRVRHPAFFVVLLASLAWLPPASAADLPPGMAVVQTRYYRIHSDLEPDLTADLARRMDGMFDEYQRRLASFRTEQSAPPMEVYLFRRQQDYLRFTGDRWRNSGGVYMSGRNLLAAFLEGQGRDALRRTLQHEAFHQFAHLAISPDMPVWLNEGMAQLFEEGIWTGDGFLLGQVPPRRIRQLKSDIDHKRLVRFDRLLSISHEDWAHTLAGNRDAGATQYNQSWAMVHFLIQAHDANGHPKYRGRFIQMLDLLHKGRGGTEAFEAAFYHDTTNFEARFVEYARTLQPTPEANMIERQEVLAHFLIELKNQGRKFDRIADLRETAVKGNLALRYSSRNMTWSTDPNVKTYFCDMDDRPLDASDLYFDPRSRAPLPDIVCRASDRLVLRTRFHPTADDRLEHEVLVEPPSSQASAGD